MDDVLDMNDNSCDKLILEDRVTMLNADQRRIFEHVKEHLLHQQQHEANQLVTSMWPLNGLTDYTRELRDAHAHVLRNLSRVLDM